jgi:hypothetical protein
LRKLVAVAEVVIKGWLVVMGSKKLGLSYIWKSSAWQVFLMHHYYAPTGQKF